MPALAQDSLRIATFNTELSRKGPGLLLRDILRGDDPQVRAVVDVLAHARADIVVLQGIDYDLTGAALGALADAVGAAGAGSGSTYPHRFARRPNTGMRTGLDMDGDGRTDQARDAQGYGAYSGKGGMAILSRYPVVDAAVRDFTDLLWRDLPGASLPRTAQGPFPSADVQAIQRLSTTAHWVVPFDTPQGALSVMTWHATPPVFDGPEDRNGLRNADEARFWQVFLDGKLGPAPRDRFILVGDANLDANAGDGRRAVMRALLDDPRLQDPAPAAVSGQPQTVDWGASGIGKMRVDYVLPSADWTVLDSGVLWPAPADPFAETVVTASRHRLVWVDISR